MKIKELSLFTNNLESEKKFYSKTLGFNIIDSSLDHFSLKIGWSRLTFKQSKEVHYYHYCFLIPSNKLHEAFAWMEQRTDIIDIENGRKTQRFESWNADSFYFYDASGNVAECIVRYDLSNQSNNPFDIDQFICVNEIGLPTDDIEKTNLCLENQIGTHFWKGDTTDFGTNGTQKGLFLLPNYKTKKKWFPTNLNIEPSPFEAIIEYNRRLYSLLYLKESLKINN